MNFFLEQAYRKSYILMFGGILIMIVSIILSFTFPRENNFTPYLSGIFLLTMGIMLQGIISLACYLKDEPVLKKEEN